MANITVLEALQLSLNATKKYVDDKIAETSSGGGEELPVVTSSATTFDVARTDIDNAITTMPALIYFDPTNDITNVVDNTTIYIKGLCLIFMDSDGMTNYIFLYSNIAIKFDSDNYSYVRTLYTPKANILSKYNTIKYTPTADYHPATKKYVDDEVAKVNASGGYTHPDTHPASMITGLATVATSGDYNDLNNKPSIPTVTNDLTDSLKANYDAAYTHSTSAHAPVNAQKNSDITKAEIETKLTGNITSHTHSQYLTSIPSEYITEQELTSKGYATESQINSAIEAAATTHEEVKTTVNQILGGAYIE